MKLLLLRPCGGHSGNSAARAPDWTLSQSGASSLHPDDALGSEQSELRGPTRMERARSRALRQRAARMGDCSERISDSQAAGVVAGALVGARFGALVVPAWLALGARARQRRRGDGASVQRRVRSWAMSRPLPGYEGATEMVFDEDPACALF